MYLVQDTDRPMYVFADDYGHAERRWRERIAIENEQEFYDVDFPQGITLVVENQHADFPDVLMPEDEASGPTAKQSRDMHAWGGERGEP